MDLASENRFGSSSMPGRGMCCDIDAGDDMLANAMSCDVSRRVSIEIVESTRGLTAVLGFPINPELYSRLDAWCPRSLALVGLAPIIISF